MTADRPSVALPEPRGVADASIVSAGLRERVRDLATPVAKGLGRLGLTPNALTIIGFIGTCVAAAAATFHLWLLAGILVLVFGVFDLFDGALARATGRATKLGAFLDSTFDRAGEAIVYIGVALGCIAEGYTEGAALSASAMAAAFMVSYTRAKAESLGFSSGSGLASVGLAPREVRLAILGVGLIVTGLVSHFTVMEPAGCVGLEQREFFDCLFMAQQMAGASVVFWTLGAITVLATLTAIQRILHVRAQSREG